MADDEGSKTAEKSTSNLNENNASLHIVEEAIAQTQPTKTPNESFRSYLRRQWQIVREYNLEPTEPPYAVENTPENRIKGILHVNRSEEGLIISPQLEEIRNTFVSAVVVGVFFGGRYGARYHTASFIETHKAAVYEHVRQAERHMQSHALYGFGKYAFRWGWRLGICAGMFSVVKNVVAAARNKDDGLNIFVAGTSTGFAYKMFHGWKEIVVGVVLGTGISIPLALMQQGMHMLTPESVRAHEQQERMSRQLQLQEQWRKRLGQTDEEISKISDELLSAEINFDISDLEAEQMEDSENSENTEDAQTEKENNSDSSEDS